MMLGRRTGRLFVHANFAMIFLMGPLSAAEHDKRWMTVCRKAYLNDQKVGQINRDHPNDADIATNCKVIRQIISLKEQSVRLIESTDDHCAEDNVLANTKASIERASAHYQEVCH